MVKTIIELALRFVVFFILIYCHKSYIMNIDNILEIEKDKIVFTNNIELLLSENSIRKIKKTIKENFNN